jgi:hypothetical protein
MSHTAFRTIVENALHLQFAIQVSTDRGMMFSSQDAWRHQLLAKAPMWDAEQRAQRAQLQAKLPGSNQSKTDFNKKQFGFKGKSGNKGGKFASKHGVGKKKDTSHYICRLCNTKGHGPWDKNDKGD